MQMLRSLELAQDARCPARSLYLSVSGSEGAHMGKKRLSFLFKSAFDFCRLTWPPKWKLPGMQNPGCCLTSVHIL